MTDKKNVSAVLMTITPEIAAGFLAMNRGNRHINVPAVRRLVDEINGGRWQINGATISISNTNRLLDGQHRLTAIVKSGVAVQSLVVFGVEDKAQGTQDSGGAGQRTLAQRIAFNKANDRKAGANASARASVVRWVRWCESGMTSVAELQSVGLFEELDDRYGEGIDTMISLYNTATAGLSKANIFGPAAFAYYFERDLVSAAMHRFATGEGLFRGDPVHALRSELLAHNAHGGTRRLDTMTVARKAVSMLHKVITREPSKQIKPSAESVAFFTKRQG